MNWRAIINPEIHTQYSQNPQNSHEERNIEDIGNNENRTENKNLSFRYGCGNCGNIGYEPCEMWQTYKLPDTTSWTWEHKLEQGYRCTGCGAEYLIIDGNNGHGNKIIQ